MTKRVLVLAYYFPPMAVSGSMRPAGFCSHLHEYGYVAHVMSNAVPPTEGGTIPVDQSLMRLVPDGLRIDRIAHADWMQGLLDLRARVRGTQAAVPSPAASAGAAAAPGGAARAAPIRQLRERIMNRLLLFPDRQNRWIAAVRRAVRTLAPHERPDVVFATGNPWSSLVAGLDVAKMLGVPFVADFRDPWTQNPKPPLPELVAPAAKCERHILTGADRIIANTPALQDAFATLYPASADKIVTITNGYHESLLVPAVNERAPDAQSSGIELEYYGSVYELRKPTVLLEAVAALADSGHIRSGEFRITFTGNWGVSDPACNALAERLETHDLIRREAAVSHTVYLERIRAAQHLLVLQQDFPLQIPGKIYEYVATGRPLFLVGGEGATASLVRNHRLGHVCADNHADLCEAITALVERRLSIVPPAPDTIAAFGYAALTRQLAGVLDEVVNR